MGSLDEPGTAWSSADSMAVSFELVDPRGELDPLGEVDP